VPPWLSFLPSSRVFSPIVGDIAAGRQRHVVTRLQLAADRVQVAFAGGDAEVASRRQAAALGGGLLALG
jgi:hypothetical protein